MKTATRLSFALILAIGLLYGPFDVLDRYAKHAGRLMYSLSTTTGHVDMNGMAAGFQEIPASHFASSDLTWALVLSGVIVLASIVWSRRRAASRSKSD